MVPAEKLLKVAVVLPGYTDTERRVIDWIGAGAGLGVGLGAGAGLETGLGDAPPVGAGLWPGAVVGRGLAPGVVGAVAPGSRTWSVVDAWHDEAQQILTV
jgi:hypothetical protein